MKFALMKIIRQGHPVLKKKITVLFEYYNEWQFIKKYPKHPCTIYGFTYFGTLSQASLGTSLHSLTAETTGTLVQMFFQNGLHCCFGTGLATCN